MLAATSYFYPKDKLSKCRKFSYLQFNEIILLKELFMLPINRKRILEGMFGY